MNETLSVTHTSEAALVNPQVVYISGKIRPQILEGWKNVQDMNSQITNADFWARSDAIPSFCSETHNPRTGIINVDFGITRVHSRQGDTTPAAEFDQVFDCRYGDLHQRLDQPVQT